MAGALDADELEDRVSRALTTRTRHDLDLLVADLPEEVRAAAPPRGRRRPDRGQRVGLAAAAAGLAILAGLGVATADQEGPVEQAVCVSTGVPGAVECPESPPQQRAIEEDAADAEEAAGEAEAATTGRPAGSPEVAAARRARQAADLAGRAVADAQVVMADAPDGDPAEGAFTALARQAHAAAAAAERAAEEAEELAEG